MTTPLGSYELLVLQFGLNAAVSSFQNMMQQILRPYLTIFCMVYIDDIVIFSKNEEEHMQHVKFILEAINKAKLRINIEKCEFFRTEVKLLGWFIGIDGGFAPWVGNLITDINQKIVLVCPEGRAEEVVTRLARVGYDNTVGFLEGGFKTWTQAGNKIETVAQESAEEFALAYEDGIDVLDVRKPGEYSAEHVENVNHLPLDYIFNHLNKIDTDKTYHVHCAGGYRSVIFISILKAKGFSKLIDVAGGYGALRQTAVPKTDFVCPTVIKSN